MDLLENKRKSVRERGEWKSEERVAEVVAFW